MAQESIRQRFQHRRRACASASAWSAGISPRASSSASTRWRPCSRSSRAGCGKLTFLQVAAPSRSKLPAYQALQQQTVAELERINARFGNAGWQPIVLIGEHQEPAQVFELFRAADFTLVNSLHDGMNLVAKEFVAARDDEDGVLILSTFAGASRELPEALLVNPYDVGETARGHRRGAGHVARGAAQAHAADARARWPSTTCTAGPAAC